MRKVTKADLAEINAITLATIAEYADDWLRGGSKHMLDSLSMHTDDVIYNINALKQFNADSDAQALHSAVMSQDTFVREAFIDTLRYIENNNLIPSYRFCCV
jgi:hypothetical protein